MVRLKVHQCIWSGRFHGNTVEAIEECLRAGVERAEIDIMLLPEDGWLVLSHEFTLEQRPRLGFRAPSLDEVVRLMQLVPDAPTLIELDMMDVEPIPIARLEELLTVIQPVQQRVIFNNVGDWNLRRLQRLSPGIRVGFDPAGYLDVEDTELPLGAYGYHDAHVLARTVHSDVCDYLFDRMGGILRLVPESEEVHLRLSVFERMLDDGFDVADFLHARGMLLDVWTLDAGTPRWEQRLARAVEAGVDMVTTNTAPALSNALARTGK
ncbi:MAG TPA: hypothetical protein VFG86_26195 [Chloroflexota bacterium]|nr:hypothetical protein [Chloroflexota bacterium]